MDATPEVLTSWVEALLKTAVPGSCWAGTGAGSSICPMGPALKRLYPNSTCTARCGQCIFQVASSCTEWIHR